MKHTYKCDWGKDIRYKCRGYATQRVISVVNHLRSLSIHHICDICLHHFINKLPIYFEIYAIWYGYEPLELLL